MLVFYFNFAGSVRGTERERELKRENNLGLVFWWLLLLLLLLL